jgi:alpha-1,2-mannosyltransferase
MKALRMLAGFMAAANFAIYAAWLLHCRNGLDPVTFKPIAADFTSFWVAGRAAVTGHATRVYDLSAQIQGVLQAASYPPHSHIGIVTFSYPPIYLLPIAPFGLLPLNAAFALWMVLTNALFLAAFRGLGPKLPGILPELLALGFSGFLVNLSYGQNGALTAGLFGLGLANLRRRPRLAGICFGCLACKPQLGILIPVALLGGRQYRAALAAGCCIFLLALLSLAIFGPGSWRGFLASTQWSEHALLSHGASIWPRSCTIFAALRLWGCEPAASYALQMVAAMGAAAAVWRIWRAAPGSPRANAALLAGTVVAAPYLLNYDLMLLGIVLACLLQDAAAYGLQAGMKPLLALLWFGPALSELASPHGIPFAPALCAALLALLSHPAEQAVSASPPRHRPAGRPRFPDGATTRSRYPAAPAAFAPPARSPSPPSRSAAAP